MNLNRLTKEIKAGLIVVLGITALIMGFSYLKSNSLLGKSTTLHAVLIMWVDYNRVLLFP